MDLQAQYRNLSSSLTTPSSSSSSSLMPSLRKVNAAADNLIITASDEINWPSVAWLSSMAPTTTYSNPKELLEANWEKRVVGVQKEKKSQKTQAEQQENPYNDYIIVLFYKIYFLIEDAVTSTMITADKKGQNK
jgi:hypothetical protein